MDLATLTFLHKTFQEVQIQQDWRAALDALFVSIRGFFVFDNAAIYLEDPRTKGLEVVYARAVGRGKAAEADSMWGEGIANEVLSKGRMILKEPRKNLNYANRLTEAHLLGLIRPHAKLQTGFCLARTCTGKNLNHPANRFRAV